MAILERLVFKLQGGNWERIQQAEAVADEIEARWNFPPKRLYRPMLSGSSFDTLIIEREWESLAAMEAAETEAWSHPDMAAFFEEYSPLYGDMVREVYEVLDWGGTGS